MEDVFDEINQPAQEHKREHAGEDIVIKIAPGHSLFFYRTLHAPKQDFHGGADLRAYHQRGGGRETEDAGINSGERNRHGGGARLYNGGEQESQ